MGPTGILPGATYTTIDHADSAQDFLQDVLEAYLETDEINARKSEQQKAMTDELTKAGRDELETRDLIRGHAEAAAVDLLGASPPRAAEERAVFGDAFGPGQWKLLCPTGTAVVMDYNIFHVSAHNATAIAAVSGRPAPLTRCRAPARVPTDARRPVAEHVQAAVS